MLISNLTPGGANSAIVVDKIRFVTKGNWTSSLPYAVDDVVIHNNASYACKVSNANTTPPNLNDAEWTKLGGTMNYKTQPNEYWGPSVQYNVGDLITIEQEFMYRNDISRYEKYSFICTTAHQNKYPLANTHLYNGEYANTDYWAPISEGTGYTKENFLSDVGEGYVCTHKKLWDAFSYHTEGAINTIIVQANGNSYTSTPTITISGGGGSGAKAVPVINSSGALVDVLITDPGLGYTSTPTVQVTGGGGSGANLTARIVASANAVGMGDSVPEFKTPGTSNYELNVMFINKRYGLTYQGQENIISTYYSSGINRATAASQPWAVEMPFTCLDYYEGILPTPDGQPPKIIQVETNGVQTLVLMNNGEVHAVGYNGNGNKGENTTDQSGYAARCGYWNQNRTATTNVLRGKRAIRIAMPSTDTNESYACYALIQNPDGSRTIFSWGYNVYGQLGLGDTTARSIPTAVNFNESSNGRIAEIWAAGGNYGNLFVLTDAGRLFSCGYNGYGQLGDGTATNRSTLVEIFPVAGGSSGVVYDGWRNLTSPTNIDLRIKKFSCGYSSSVGNYSIVTQSGHLFNWGYNAAGVGYLGHGYARNVYIPLMVYSGGYTGGSGVTTTPASAGTPVGDALTDVRNVWNCNGDGTYACIYIVRGDSTSSNLLYATGYNGYYNFGDNTTTNRATFDIVQTAVAGAFGGPGLNVIDLTCGLSNNFVSVAFKSANDLEWYFGGYNNFSMPLGHQDTYNIRQQQDPNHQANIYRFKANALLPTGTHKYSKFRFYGNSSTKGIIQFNLRNGDVNRTTGAAGYFNGTNQNATPMSTMQPLPFTGM